jgi:hypothetical protein
LYFQLLIPELCKSRLSFAHPAPRKVIDHGMCSAHAVAPCVEVAKIILFGMLFMIPVFVVPWTAPLAHSVEPPSIAIACACAEFASTHTFNRVLCD